MWDYGGGSLEFQDLRFGNWELFNGGGCGGGIKDKDKVNKRIPTTT